LPSPAAAGLLTGMVWVLYSYGVPGKELSIAALLVTVFAGVAMVSNIRYRSFKHLDVKGRVPFISVLVVVLLFVLISLDPPQVLFMVFLAYAISGPVGALIRKYRHTDEKRMARLP